MLPDKLVYRLVHVLCQAENLDFPKFDSTCLISYTCGMTSKPTETLRNAVNGSKESRYAICAATGIDQAALKRFADGGDIRGETLDKLAEYFGLELKPRAKKK